MKTNMLILCKDKVYDSYEQVSRLLTHAEFLKLTASVVFSNL